MDLNSLPPECLYKILSHLPVSQLFRLRFVCLQWNTLIRDIFRCSVTSLTICSRSSTLNVHLDHLGEEPKKIKKFVLIIPGISPTSHSSGHCALFLAGLFPKITKLTLVGLHAGLGVVVILDKFRFQLTSLTLSGISIKSSILINQLWTSLNSMSSLKQLQLINLPEQMELPFQMPILSQLEHFTLLNCAVDRLSILRELGTAGTRPKRVQMDFPFNFWNDQFLELHRKPLLLPNVTEFLIFSSWAYEGFEFVELYQRNCIRLATGTIIRGRFERAKYLNFDKVL